MRIRHLCTALALLTTAATLPAATANAAAARTTSTQQAAHALPLTHLYDNTAVGGGSRPGAADFDGAGNALSAPDLSAAGWTPGRALDLDAAPLTWPRATAGRPDNVVANGQTVAVGGTGPALTFLAAATGTGAPATGNGTVRYRDGSVSGYRLTAPDWRSGPPATKAVALPHLVTPHGTVDGPARLYAVTVPLRPGRAVASVQLPRAAASGAELHVFALAVRRDDRGWTGSWATSASGYTGVGPWRDRTLRLVVHAGAGGQRVRVRFTNTFAAAPVTLGAASVAVRRGGATADGTPRRLTFRHGQRGVRVPAGAEAVSDPLGFPVPAGRDLLVSVHLPGTVTAAPVHQEAAQTSYLSAAGAGDRTADAGGGAFPETLTTWPFLTGVDVAGGPGSVVTLGDSITDGVRSTSGADHRWPDALARRFRQQHALPRYGVLNQGISANRVVTDRYPGDGVSNDMGGVSAGHRLQRDVLAQTSVRTVVLFEGINDVRWGTPAPEVVDGLRALARRAHAHGLRVVAATLTPCGGYQDCSAEVEARRQAVNAALRDQGGAFDAVLDFDAVVRDPAHPQRMLPAYDSGDHLHPGDAGLAALADSVDLRKLVPGQG
ncbi:SGNH/GDSL hydrolase family protein [Streptomyces benahoarensis]|uniref:SGNH/GDSL hydrolase family protein n=1 Tax=Streptomyces benahoarensis TaxID=2595054 RepID=A0A553ZJZ9_9ACTN|nr:SGNH/GDSL hydrolase family protein [Streptomyces benahoarensis]TSB32612.1 SGNH/GDSL hydrolase family protein [Streptomyces benahoarensis]TSB41791.1 SGNH/GDSL hydrolase family protein [Streptomyces benahoarensis]